MVESGHMWTLLFLVSACELRHFFKVVPLLDTDWAGEEPGNYGIDPFNMDTPQRRMSELKNGRLVSPLPSEPTPPTRPPSSFRSHTLVCKSAKPALP